MGITLEYLDNLPELYKGEVTERFDELSNNYKHLLDEEDEEWEEKRISQIGPFRNRDKRKLIKFIEMLEENEKEVCEIYRLNRGRGFMVIVGPLSTGRWIDIENELQSKKD